MVQREVTRIKEPEGWVWGWGVRGGGEPSLHATPLSECLEPQKKKCGPKEKLIIQQIHCNLMGVQALALEFNLCQILCGFSEELLPSLGLPYINSLSLWWWISWVKILDPLQLFIVMYSVFSAELSLYFSQFYAQCKCQDTFKLHINLRATT